MPGSRVTVPAKWKGLTRYLGHKTVDSLVLAPAAQILPQILMKDGYQWSPWYLLRCYYERTLHLLHQEVENFYYWVSGTEDELIQGMRSVEAQVNGKFIDGLRLESG